MVIFSSLNWREGTGLQILLAGGLTDKKWFWQPIFVDWGCLGANPSIQDQHLLFLKRMDSLGIDPDKGTFPSHT